MEITAIRQRLKIRLPVEADVDGVDNEIELPRKCFQCLRIAAIHHFIGTHRQYFLLFRRIRTKGRHLASHCVQKFYSDMPQPANTNYPNAAGSSDMVHQQWFKDRDTAAQQRPGGLDINIFWQWNHPLPVRTQLLGKATAIHNCWYRTLLTVDLITTNTGVAVTTATRRPANPDTLTDLQTFILCGAPERHYATNHLMPGNQRIL
ncbi:hypothetical protein ESCOMMO057M_24535 [Escherichia coli]